MSVAPVHLDAVYARRGSYYLVPFEAALAPFVAAWVQDHHALFWLAPKTPPPLTPAKMAEWPGPGGCPMLLYHDGFSEPRGYVELNPMPNESRHLWLGHCLIHPRWRGAGQGRQMVQLLLELAFVQRTADSVSLVVFPDNVAAIRCYRATGFLQVGEQTKFFPTTNRRHCMLVMRITRKQYAVLPGSPIAP